MKNSRPHYHETTCTACHQFLIAGAKDEVNDNNNEILALSDQTRPYIRSLTSSFKSDPMMTLFSLVFPGIVESFQNPTQAESWGKSYLKIVMETC